jgi:hypothetical protein
MKIGTITAVILMIASATSVPAYAQPTAEGKAANGPAGSGAGEGKAVRPTGEAGAPSTDQTKLESDGAARGTKVAPNGNAANTMKPPSGSTSYKGLGTGN